MSGSTLCSFPRHRSPKWIEDYQQSLRNDEWMMPWDDVFHTIFYVVIQERATQLNYLNTAIIARGQSDSAEFKADADPILVQVAQTIAIDEAAHYSFFLEVARLYLYYFPAQALEALFDVINNFVMPGLDIIPNRAQLGEILYRAGIYGPRQYAKDVLKIALKNLSVANRRAFSRGLKKTRLVLTLMAICARLLISVSLITTRSNWLYKNYMAASKIMKLKSGSAKYLRPFSNRVV